jgi:hypothetical protein
LVGAHALFDFVLEFLYSCFVFLFSFIKIAWRVLVGLVAQHGFRELADLLQPHLNFVAEWVSDHSL